jgi:hypothetical protein
MDYKKSINLILNLQSFVTSYKSFVRVEYCIQVAINAVKIWLT